MTKTILLLDCSKGLEERLRRQGYDVASGCVGYPLRPASLPGPVYEFDLIIYNPSLVTPQEPSRQPARGRTTTRSGQTQWETTLGSSREAELRALDARRVNDFNQDNRRELAPLSDHLLRGAILLAFINHICDDLDVLNAWYSWIPRSPRIEPTQDFRPHSSDDMEVALLPLLNVDELKRPVRQKLVPKNPYSFQGAIPLFRNRQEDFLGLSLNVGDGDGRIILLPEYEDNESIINTFVNRVLPRLTDCPIRKDIVDDFNSPTERAAEQELESIEAERNALDERHEAAKENLATAERLKRNKIESDETAVRVLGYYRTATQQDDVALFYLYKAVEAIEHRFGSEKAAKERLGNNAEWNLIGKVSNASYGDIRHAPKPGEKIKAWSKEEIDKCFAGARNIIHAYFSTLF